MDNFQEIFGSAENWNTTDDTGREALRGESASSVDSSTPPPQNIDDRDEKRINSIRGKGRFLDLLLITLIFISCYLRRVNDQFMKDAEKKT